MLIWRAKVAAGARCRVARCHHVIRPAAARKPAPPPVEKPAFSFGSEPQPPGIYKFTGRVMNAIAGAGAYGQGDLVCFHARHVWQLWREPEVPG